ncbi:hypothetical protein HMI54_000833 [Coelomomyces lativittatus]|nr:hypothetical protein HMI54_000833 [Coelomomyces lativittatus]
MGNSQSQISDENMEVFEANTFFRRKEILRIYSYFHRVTQGTNTMHPSEFIMIPELQCNPFRKRIAEVFSNEKNIIEFEDFLDFLSVFSEDATADVKSYYAFRIYDFDDDEYLNGKDVRRVLEYLVNDNLTDEEMETVLTRVFEEADIDGDGKLSYIEFEHVIARCPDFANTFRLRL